MSSRRLWILVSLLSLPFLAYTTMGCDSVFGVPFEPKTNAYTCECSCDAGERNGTSRVLTGADDADERVVEQTVADGGPVIRITPDFLAGVRFSNLGIPPNATIQSASVQFTAGADSTDAATIAVRVEASPNALPFTALNGDLSNRPAGSELVTWSPGGWTTGAAEADQLTPDLANLIQEVVALPGWTEQSSLVLLLNGVSGARRAVSFEGNQGQVPVLHVTYVTSTETVTARLPVCTLGATGETDGDDDGIPDALAGDCSNRVKNTYEGLVDTCGYLPGDGNTCECNVKATGYDKDSKPYYGFTAQACGQACTPEEVSDDCSNFDPSAFAACLQAPPNGDPAECLHYVSATNGEDGDPVCVADTLSGTEAGAMASRMFGQRSTCEVTGQSHIDVGGEQPKEQPATRGTLDILGTPCPGQSCSVSLGTHLNMDPIEFEVRFASNPKFTDMIQAGNTGLGAASLGASGVGTVPPESTIGVARGRRGDDRAAFIGSNQSPLDLTVDWAGYSCSLQGDLATTVDGENPQGLCSDEATLCRTDADCGENTPCELSEGDPQPMNVNVDVAGSLINQPPTAKAGADQTVECTSTAGATFVLDGSQSSDPDGDIRIVSWREGSRLGPEVGPASHLSAALGTGESRAYVLRVIDSFAQADEDEVSVGVVDTTPPQILCNAPAVMVPRSTPTSFIATAEDTCTEGVVPEIVGYDCFKVNGAGKQLDKTSSCKVSLRGNTITIHNSGGVGQHIRWTARAMDGSNHGATKVCEIEVVNGSGK